MKSKKWKTKSKIKKGNLKSELQIVKWKKWSEMTKVKWQKWNGKSELQNDEVQKINAKSEM